MGIVFLDIRVGCGLAESGKRWEFSRFPDGGRVVCLGWVVIDDGWKSEKEMVKKDDCLSLEVRPRSQRKTVWLGAFKTQHTICIDAWPV